VFQSAVDRFGGSVAGAGPVEVGEHVGGALAQGSSESAELGQGSGYALGERCDHRGQSCFPVCAVGVAVGGDQALVDAPGRFDFDVIIGGEQVFQALLLPVGEQVGSGVQGPPGTVAGRWCDHDARGCAVGRGGGTRPTHRRPT